MRTLTEKFAAFLDSPPSPQEYFLELKEKMAQGGVSFGGYLLLDGDWFGRKRCLLLYKDVGTGKLLYWRFADGEYYLVVFQDLIFLSDHGYPFNGVTSDWRGGIVLAVKSLSTSRGQEIPHQRCLVHTQLLVQGLLTRKPETEAGCQLLELTYSLNRIRNDYEKNIWLKWLRRWGERHIGMLKEKTHEENGHWWYTHKNLRRAYRTLASDTASLFRYLEDGDLPKDTNGIEGVFSQLDGKVSRHRGLSQKRKEALISYYFYLREFSNFDLKTNT